MAAIPPCIRCYQPPRKCECFDYWARIGFPAAILDGGLLVFVRPTSGQEGAWLAVVVQLGERTTTSHLREAEPALLAWRDGLRRHQGPWVSGGPNQLLEQMDREQRARRVSHAEWAKRFNRRIELEIRAHYAWASGYLTSPGIDAREQAVRLWQALGESRQDAERWVGAERKLDPPSLASGIGRILRGRRVGPEREPVPQRYLPLANDYGWNYYGRPEGISPQTARSDAIRRLQILGYKKAEQVVDEALERLGRRQPPFLPGEPVERDRIIAALRTWRRRRKARS